MDDESGPTVGGGRAEMIESASSRRFRHTPRRLIRLLLDQSSRLGVLFLASLIWLFCDAALFTWQTSIRELNPMAFPSFVLEAMTYLAPLFYFTIWHHPAPLSRQLGWVLLPPIAALLMSPFTGPLMVDLLAYAWNIRTHLTPRPARVLSVASLMSLVGTLIFLARRVLAFSWPKSSIMGCAAAAPLATLLANVLASWGFEWTILFAFALPALSASGGYVIASFLPRTLVGAYLRAMPLVHIRNWVLALGRRARILWGIVFVLAIMFYLLLPSPGAELNTLARLTCYERADTLLPFPVRRRPECDLRLRVPRYVVARRLGTSPFSGGGVIIEIDVPISVENNSSQFLSLQDIGDIASGIPSGGGLLTCCAPDWRTFIKFPRAAIPLRIGPRGTAELRGLVSSTGTGSVEPLDEGRLERLDRDLREELLKELRWGRDWSVLPDSQVELVLITPKEKVNVSEKILVLIPPKGWTLRSPRTALQKSFESEVEVGMKVELPPKEALESQPGSKRLREKLETLSSADRERVRGELGEPERKEPHRFRTLSGIVIVDRWTYYCTQIIVEANLLCVFHLSFHEGTVAGWSLATIDERKLTEASERFRDIVREHVRFKRDAERILGAPYWRLKNKWYYPVPEAPTNVLLSVSFMFGAFAQWEMFSVVGMEQWREFHGIELFELVRLGVNSREEGR